MDIIDRLIDRLGKWAIRAVAASEKPPRPTYGPFGVKTRFLLWLITQTRWEDRATIGELKRLECYWEDWFPGRSRGMFYEMPTSAIRRRYSLESEAIRRELCEGVETGPEEYWRLVEEQETRDACDAEAARLRAAAEARQREDQLAREYELWIEEGGLP